MKYQLFWIITSRVQKLPFWVKIWYFVLLFDYNKRKYPTGNFHFADYVLWAIKS